MGGVGVLDVILDGQTLFSSKAAGRLPSPEEVVDLIRQHQR